MLVSEIMTTPAFSVQAGDPLDEALRLMAERNVTGLPVVDADQVVVGVLSEMDVLRRALQPDSRAHMAPTKPAEPLPDNVGQIMTPKPRTTTPRHDVNDLASLFLATGFKSLPVIDGGMLVGVVSRSDVIRALWRDDADLAADVAQAFRDAGLQSWQTVVKHGVVTVTGPSTDRERATAAAVASSILGVRRVTTT